MEWEREAEFTRKIEALWCLWKTKNMNGKTVAADKETRVWVWGNFSICSKVVGLLKLGLSVLLTRLA